MFLLSLIVFFVYSCEVEHYYGKNCDEKIGRANLVGKFRDPKCFRGFLEYISVFVEYRTPSSTLTDNGYDVEQGFDCNFLIKEISIGTTCKWVVEEQNTVNFRKQSPSVPILGFEVILGEQEIVPGDKLTVKVVSTKEDVEVEVEDMIVPDIACGPPPAAGGFFSLVVCCCCCCACGIGLLCCLKKIVAIGLALVYSVTGRKKIEQVSLLKNNIEMGSINVLQDDAVHLV